MAAGILLYDKSRLLGPSGPSGVPQQGETIAEKDPLAKALILRPRLEPIKLVAPPPRPISAKSRQKKDQPEQLIPFDGLYWVFQPPLFRPPYGSPQREGDPFLLNVHSNDESPIRLTAVQTLAAPLAFAATSHLTFVFKAAPNQALDFSASAQLRNQRFASNHAIRFPSTTPTCSTSECTLEFSHPTSLSLTYFDEILLSITPPRDRPNLVPRIALLGFRCE